MSDQSESKHVPIVERNVSELMKQFNRNPDAILVSIQFAEDQEAHLASGLQAHVRRRMVPLPVLAALIEQLNSRAPGARSHLRKFHNGQCLYF